MRLRETKQTIAAYADALKTSDAAAPASSMAMLASFLGEFGNEQTSTLVQRARKVDRPTAVKQTASPELPTASQVAKQLESLNKILKSVSASVARRKDLTSLSRLLRSFGESEILSAVLDKLRNAMKPEPIEEQIEGFIEQLKNETGTPEFDSTFAKLASSSLKRDHVVTVALTVYGGIKRNTSRKRALDFIRKPHDAYISAKRGIDATAGRSAA